MSSYLKENAGAAFALSFLVFVAVTKTLLTKVVFVSMDQPVAYSILSCLVTNASLTPIFGYQPGSFKFLTKPMLKSFGLVCVAITADLAFTNVALSLLSVAFQQTIKSISPAATLLVERCLEGKTEHPALYVVVLLLCVGPILTGLGSDFGDASPVGIVMMLASVLAGAFKYVMAHKLIKTFKKELGTLSFLYWVEWFAVALLTPWALLNGELVGMVMAPDRPLSDWLLLLFTAAYGGVRVYSQFYLLNYSSATTLALSNLAVQALTILLGVFFFGTEVTPYLASGVAVTLVFSGVYTWLKVAKPFAPPKRGEPVATKEIGAG